MNKGKLITIEGIDGCGKTLLINNLQKQLSSQDIIFTKEPGATPLGEKLREILQEKNRETADLTEFLLFATDRAEHFEKVIIPALQKNKIVISDRCADSSLAYQGFGRGLDKEMIKKVNNWAMQNVKPNITIYIKIDEQMAFERIKKRNAQITAFEKQKKDFWIKVINGYEKIFENRKNVITIDGTQSPQVIVRQVLAEGLTDPATTISPKKCSYGKY